MNIKDLRFPIDCYMLLWFTNPDNVGNEQGLSSQFFTSLKEATQLAEMLSGSRIILTCKAQNAPPDSNAYWYAVKTYGSSFDLNSLKSVFN